MAEINRQDLISDEALKAPGELANEFDKVADVLDEIIAKGKENQTMIEQAKSIKELSKKVAELEKEQKKLSTANQQLRDAQKRQAQATKDQAEAMDALDNRMGGVISRAKQMGKEFLALMKNPFIALLAVLVVTFTALASAVKTFLTATGEGEDILNRQKAVWNQFFATLKKGWKDLGKSVTEALGEDGLQGFLFAVLAYFSPKYAALFMKTSQQAKSLADVIDDIETRMSQNIIKRAQTERDYNKFSLEAEKLKLTNQVEAVRFLEAGIKKKEEQMRIDTTLAKQNADATLYQMPLEHSLTKEQVDRMTFAERDAEFTGAQMKKIAEAYAEVINLEGAYEQEVRRNTAKIIAFKEQIRKAIVEAAQKAAEGEIEESRRISEQRIMDIKDDAIAGVITKKQAEQQIRKFEEQSAAQFVNTQIEALEKVLKVKELNAEEEAAIDKALFDLKTELVETYYKQLKDGLSFEDIAAAYTDFTNQLGNLFQSFTEQRLQQIDQEEERLEKYYDTRIKMAGDNEARVSEIENEAARRREKLEDKKIQVQRRAAIFDKAISATQAGIATALAIVSMLKIGPAGIPLSIAAGITGALQVAAILAKPIPQYAEGGTTVADLILAGERGFEQYQTPGGKIGYTPDGPTFMRLPIGTKIKPHEETLRDLAANSMDVGGRQGNADDAMLSDRIYNKLDSLENTIRNKKEVHMNWTKKGIERAIVNGESRTYFLNEFYD